MKGVNTFLGLSLLAVASTLAAAPSYQAEACCQLCPAAAKPAAYAAPGLGDYRRLIEAEDGWLFRTGSDLRTQFGLDEASYRQLRRLRNALKQRGVELLMVYQPSRGLLHADKLSPPERATFDLVKARRNYSATLQRLRALEIWVPELNTLLETQPGAEDYFFKGDLYWTPQGAERTAGLVARAAQGIPAFAQLPRQAFVSKPVGLLGRYGALQRAAAQICGAGYPSQFVPRYITEPEGAGTTLPAEVALVGSGNSGDAFNFAGFLAQHLGTPVHNASSSGGYASALLHYLMSAEFQNSPPKLLIWELDDVERLAQPKFYRQAIPAIGDGCAGRPILLQSHTRLQGGADQVLFNGTGEVLPIHGSDYRIDLQFDDPRVKRLRVTLTLMNGRQETLDLSHPPTLDGRGRFLLELRDDADWDELTFLSLHVQLAERLPPGQGLRARLCNGKSTAQPKGQRTVQLKVQ